MGGSEGKSQQGRGSNQCKVAAGFLHGQIVEWVPLIVLGARDRPGLMSLVCWCVGCGFRRVSHQGWRTYMFCRLAATALIENVGRAPPSVLGMPRGWVYEQV